MKKFKKLCCILLAVALLCVGLVGCGGQDDQKITNLSIGGAGTSGTFYILGAVNLLRPGTALSPAAVTGGVEYAR